ncbi:MAG: hypothetical protein C0601_12660 [Candidatus Muiribacterium halophilum]|uniref:N-acetyltransferase domain-containing protein n=1 Tax=Muiribacterium halophilum TaxID=2053465 RepID=A0A2N5ZA38_MUIH1|nr:MAG: hypothetical protein C0601_12660 [Candidatus Muirbacterium halophilum]
MEYIRKKIGNTVLYNSKVLANKNNVDNLFFKMEGVNPTGRIQDRLAFALVKEAIQLGHDSIAVTSLGPLGTSIAYVSEITEMDCYIYIPKGSRDKKNKWYQMPHVKLVETGKNYKQAFEQCQKDANENNWYNANPGYENISITTTVYSEISHEIVRKLGKNPDNIFIYMANGSVLLGLHHGFRELWYRGVIDRIPTIFTGCTETNHKLLDAFKKGKRNIDEAYTTAFSKKTLTRNNVNYMVVDPQGVLNSIYDSGGHILEIDEIDVKENVKEIYKAEKIKVFPRGCLAYMTFKKANKLGLIKEDDTNVIILEEGKAAIEVKVLSEENFDSLDTIVNYTMKYLGEYGDDKVSTKEAVEYASKNGFIIGAFLDNSISGIAVVIRMPLKIVLPEYHLVYIGTDLRKGSRGIGTHLMKKIHELTGGNFSLHVDLQNKKAIRVYEKMGLKKSYIRMINYPEE